MNELSLLYNYLLVGGLLFVVGMIGFFVRRNMIVMFLCAEMMLQGVSLSLIAFGRYHGSLVQPVGSAGPWGGQMLVIFIITVAACEAVIIGKWSDSRPWIPRSAAFSGRRSASSASG